MIPTTQPGPGHAAAAALAALLACSPGGSDAPPGDFTREDLQRRILELYRQARDAGESVPADAYEWARADLARVGDWEYRVLRLEAGADAALQARLDALGAERWELFWLEATDDGHRAFARRPARSHLARLPLSDLRRLVPGAPD